MHERLLDVGCLRAADSGITNLRSEAWAIALDQRAFGPRQLVVAFADVDKPWFGWRPRDLAWSVSWLNMAGSIAFGIMLSRIEGRHPLWSFTTAVCGVFISLIVFFNCCAWIVAAYRPEYGADVIQSWYDWAWFAFLLGWIYLSLEMAATGVVELMDDRPRPMIPRWFTWLTLAGSTSAGGCGSR